MSKLDMFVERFKKDMNMDDKMWRTLCRRYAKRDKTLILQHLKDLYGDLPDEAEDELEKIMLHCLDKNTK